MLASFLEANARVTPDKEAIVFHDRRISWEDLDRRAGAFANRLIRDGVDRDDRVLLYMENSDQAAAAIFGTLKRGAIFSFINAMTKRWKLGEIARDARPAAIVTDGARARTALAVAESTPSVRAVYVAGAEAKRRAVPLEEIFASESPLPHEARCLSIDLAAIIYTSGSTGVPKGVMLTHHNIVSASTSITTYLENVPSDRVLNVLPFSFDYGLYQLLMVAQFGGTLILERSFAYPPRIIDLLVEERATGFPIVPTMAAILLGMKDLAHRDLSCVRYLTNTAAALPRAHIEGLRRLFPAARLYSMYGLTECKRVSYLPPEELDRHPLSVGRAMPDEEVWLVDEEGRRIEEPGVHGELVVRGPNVMRGYWEKPEETREVLRPGKYPWENVLYTGDIFYQDEEGFLYFVGRKDDIIKTRGEKVSPKEIENVVCAMEGVAEAAVIGVDDPVLGQAVKLFVVPRPGSRIGEREVLRHCRAQLENFMVPKFVEIRPSLPRNPSGKIDKLRLR